MAYNPGRGLEMRCREFWSSGFSASCPSESRLSAPVVALLAGSVHRNTPRLTWLPILDTLRPRGGLGCRPSVGSVLSRYPSYPSLVGPSASPPISVGNPTEVSVEPPSGAAGIQLWVLSLKQILSSLPDDQANLITVIWWSLLREAYYDFWAVSPA